MRNLHAMDIVGMVLILVAVLSVSATLARLARWIRYDGMWSARRWYQRARRRWGWFLNAMLGRADVIVSAKSLPFFAMIHMPEGDYLGVVTFRKYTEGRARGRKRIRVRAHIVMQPDEGIPLGDGGNFTSTMLAHANDLDDAARQVAEMVTRIRIRTAGAGWRPKLMTQDD